MAAADKRVFGEAGDFNENPDEVATGPKISTGIGRALIHPKYLHSNATSHPWVFGAIAELFDNAIDQHDSTYVCCEDETNPENGEPMLVVQDDGGGMDPEGMHKLLSLGMCTKQGQNKIGQYGNGFKSGTMRIGSCVIIFTRSRKAGTKTIGLLSYRFLRMEQLQEVIVPMLSWDADGKPMTGGDEDQWKKNQELIFKWSPFKTLEQLEGQFAKQDPETREYDHYTRIVIFNLWQDTSGQLELDFSAPRDIRVRPTDDEVENIVNAEIANKYRGYRLSLRQYLAVLYRNIKTDKPNFTIYLRTAPVEPFRIENELIYTKTYDYIPREEGKPKEKKPRKFKIIVGFVREMERPDLRKAKGMPMGFLVYNCQRLIHPYWEVFKNHSSHGKGVVGVVDVDFIKPSHNKQSFETGPALQKLGERLKKAVKDYWNENCTKVGYVSNHSKSKRKTKSKPEKDEDSDFVEVEEAPLTPPASLPNKNSPPQQKPPNIVPKNTGNQGADPVVRDVWTEEEQRGEGDGMGGVGMEGMGYGGMDYGEDVEYGENGRPKRRLKPINHFDPMPEVTAGAVKRPASGSRNGTQPPTAKRQRIFDSSDDENQGDRGDARVLTTQLEGERERVKELEEKLAQLTREAEETRAKDEFQPQQADTNDEGKDSGADREIVSYYEKRLERANRKLDEKTDKYKKYKNLSSEYQSQIEAGRVVEQWLRDEVQTLTEQLQQARDELAREKSKPRLRDEVQTLTEQLQQARDELAREKLKPHTDESEYSRLKVENAALKGKVGEVTGNFERKTRQWNNEFDEIRKEAESWKRRYEEQKRQLDGMRASFGHLMGEDGVKSL